MSEASGSTNEFRNQQHYNGNSEGSIGEKKPFNKKKWRDEHYSIKSKLERHDNSRKRWVMRNYHKDLKKEDKSAAHPGTREPKKEKKPVVVDEKKRRYLEVQAAKAVFQEKLAVLKEEHAKWKAERSLICDTIAAKKKQRFERQKKFSAKTKKGQPVMRGRIELLLKEIEKKVKDGPWK